MSERFDIELRIASHPKYCCVVRAVVQATLHRLDCADDLCDRVTLAVDEAVTNIIRHGYKNATDRPIWLRLLADSHPPANDLTLRIVLEDEADPVDPALIRSPNHDTHQPGGLGVRILQQVMDEVHYQPRTDGKGMRLTMIRHARHTASAMPSQEEEERTEHE